MHSQSWGFTLGGTRLTVETRNELIQPREKEGIKEAQTIQASQKNSLGSLVSFFWLKVSDCVKDKYAPRKSPQQPQLSFHQEACSLIQASGGGGVGSLLSDVEGIRTITTSVCSVPSTLVFSCVIYSS